MQRGKDMTLNELAEEMFQHFENELSLTDYQCDDEDPSFVAITLYSDEYVDEEESVMCRPIESWLAKQDLTLYDEYDERDIDYILSSVQFDGDSYSIFLRER